MHSLKSALEDALNKIGYMSKLEGTALLAKKVFSTRTSASWQMVSIASLLIMVNGCQLGMHATQRHHPVDMVLMWPRMRAQVNSSLDQRPLLCCRHLPRHLEMVWPSLESVTTVVRLVTGGVTALSLQSSTQLPMEAATMEVVVAIKKVTTMVAMVGEVTKTGVLHHLVLAIHPPS